MPDKTTRVEEIPDARNGGWIMEHYEREDGQKFCVGGSRRALDLIFGPGGAEAFERGAKKRLAVPDP